MVRAKGEGKLRVRAGDNGAGPVPLLMCSAGDSRAVKWWPTVNTHPRHSGDLRSLTNAKVDKQCEMMISRNEILYGTVVRTPGALLYDIFSAWASSRALWPYSVQYRKWCCHMLIRYL
jgi:hypothetical protein